LAFLATGELGRKSGTILQSDSFLPATYRPETKRRVGFELAGGEAYFPSSSACSDAGVDETTSVDNRFTGSSHQAL
jgi:hypothetical protein